MHISKKGKRCSKETWREIRLTDKKETVYKALAATLDDLSIAITPSDNQPDAFCIDFEAYEKSLGKMNTVLQGMQGDIALYASKKVRKALISKRQTTHHLERSTRE